MHSPDQLRKIAEDELAKLTFPQQPQKLYDPVRYTLALGGKRLRPVLTLMGAELVGGNYQNAVYPALGIELFHNFTLLHDDIMDNAPLRRGKATVYKKWNSNIAILSGDVMFAEACRLVSSAPSETLKAVLDAFYRAATTVCEGQQLDMDFEELEDVTVSDYMEMIGKKTAALLGASLQIGALCGGADVSDSERLYAAGMHYGLAFQLQDDLLDVFGDPDIFGKQKGGDIISGKKTFLRLRAMELADNRQKGQLQNSYAIPGERATEKINGVVAILDELGIREEALSEIKIQLQLGEAELNKIDYPEENKSALKQLTAGMILRTT